METLETSPSALAFDFTLLSRYSSSPAVIQSQNVPAMRNFVVCPFKHAAVPVTVAADQKRTYQGENSIS